MCAYLKFEQANICWCSFIDFTHCACVVSHTNQTYVDSMHVGIVYILCVRVVAPCVHTWSLSEWTIAAVIFLILPTVRAWFHLIVISWNCLYFVQLEVCTREHVPLWCHVRELEVWEMILRVVVPCVRTWSLSEWTIAAVIFLILPTVRAWFCLIVISWNCLYFVPRRRSSKPSAVAFRRN